MDNPNLYKLTKINSCLSTGGDVCRFVALQLNDEYHTTNDIWFIEKDDWEASSRNNTFSATTEENTASGDARESIAVQSFNETGNITFKEDIRSAFLQLLNQVQGQDQFYIKDFMQCGLNMKYVTCFPDGSQEIKTRLGVSVTNMDSAFEQLQASDSEISMDLQYNSDAITTVIGGNAVLPSNYTEVTATITTDTSVAGQITVSISDVVDPDELIIEPQVFSIKSQDEDGNIEAITLTQGVEDVVLTVDPGKHFISVGYAYYTDTANKTYFRNIYVSQEIETI